MQKGKKTSARTTIVKQNVIRKALTKTRTLSTPRTTMSNQFAKASAGAGMGRTTRKNLNINQDQLDRTRAKLGAKTETETVALALIAAENWADFQRELLAGFDKLMAVRGLTHVDAEANLEFTGFGQSARSR